MCKTLRVLNSLKDYKVGIPLTLDQYQHLSAQVVIDRLLNRRLFPLASEITQFLNIPDGQSRVLAHWACHKVSKTDEDDEAIARSIINKLNQNNGGSKISYCDIASKAAECGKDQLAIRLLERETSKFPIIVLDFK